VEIKSDDDGHWVTIDGTHVLIGTGGTILKGPAELVGKPEGDARMDSSGKKKTLDALDAQAKPADPKNETDPANRTLKATAASRKAIASGKKKDHAEAERLHNIARLYNPAALHQHEDMASYHKAQIPKSPSSSSSGAQARSNAAAGARLKKSAPLDLILSSLDRIADLID
jgi:hypothetical protein